MKQFSNLCPETARYVEALHSILVAEKKFYDALYFTYHEEELVKANMELYGIDKIFDELKEKAHSAIGHSVELGLTGFLSRPNIV